MPPRSGDTGSIEFLPPDERAFGPPDGLTFAGVDLGLGPVDELADDEPPRSRWAGVAAGVAVAALLAAGVLAAAPWDDAGPFPSAATPTTAAPRADIATPTPEAPGTAAADPGPAEPGFVLDPLPDGLRPAGYVRADQRIDAPGGWGEVWATPGATRTQGRWLSLTLLPFRTLGPAPATSTPVELTGRTGRAEVDADGVVTLAWDAGSVDAARLVTLRATGFSIDELAAIADSIAIVDDRPQMVDDRPEFLRPELLEGLTRIAAAATDGDLVVDVVTARGLVGAALYRTVDGTDTVVVQHQRGGAASDDPLLALALIRFDMAPDGWTVPEGVRGTDLVVGRTRIGEDDLVVVRWQVDDRVVSVIGTGGLDDTLALVPTVRQAPPDEWASLARWSGSVSATGGEAAQLAPWDRGS